MAILTTINGIPLFSTEAEAVAWASSRGLVGFHTHEYQGQTGYMGGIDHSQALTNNPTIVEQPIIEEIETPEPNIIINNTSSSTSSSGGGGGGY